MCFLSPTERSESSTLDSNSYHRGASMAVSVISARCPQNHPCPAVRVCTVGALAQRGYAAPVVNAAKCIDCGKCVRACPMSALRT
ncbi:MAG: 4Fe-4S binding protein [Spirochaetia bacterium]